MKKDEQYQVRTVDRALTILKLFIDFDSALSLTDISSKVQLNKSTSYRLLQTLVNNGFMEQSLQTGKYRLGVATLALGDAFLRQNDLCQRAHEALVQLRNSCGETVHLAVLEGSEVVYLDKLPGLHAIGLMSSRVGGRSPAYCTGVGKVLLAYKTNEVIIPADTSRNFKIFTPHTITTQEGLNAELKKIRQNGYGIDSEEHEIGVACIAGPIFDHLGILAAISVSGPVERITTNMNEFVKLVREEAARISLSFGGTMPLSKSV
jgi:IclR family KDG regulon transcriptional repressor